MIKLCDRIANVEASLKVPSKLSIYKNEQSSFKEAIYVDEMANPLWVYLDGLLESKIRKE